MDLQTKNRSDRPSDRTSGSPAFHNLRIFAVTADIKFLLPVLRRSSTTTPMSPCINEGLTLIGKSCSVRPGLSIRSDFLMIIQGDGRKDGWGLKYNDLSLRNLRRSSRLCVRELVLPHKCISKFSVAVMCPMHCDQALTPGQWRQT
eukprot:1078533-Amphidinium_carterae.2